MTGSYTGRVTALGAYILDVLGRPVDTIPPGQGSVLLEEIRATPAGTAAGPAVDLAKLGAQVTAVGAVGDDLIADVLASALASRGIDTSGLVRKAGRPTAATILPIRPNGERPALHAPGAMPHLEIADIDPAAVTGADVLLIGAPDALGAAARGGPDTSSLDGQSGREGLAGLAGRARDAGVLVVVDVLRPGSPKDFRRLTPLLSQADWFCPNDEQLRRLTGQDDLADGIRDVLALGTGRVAVTMGADGCLVSTDRSGGLARIPAPVIDVVDTTGCGDGFDAGLITGLLLGCDPVDAARLGTACGALVATGLGSDAGITSLAAAIDFLGRVEPEAAARIAQRNEAEQAPAGAGP